MLFFCLYVSFYTLFYYVYEFLYTEYGYVSIVIFSNQIFQYAGGGPEYFDSLIISGGGLNWLYDGGAYSIRWLYLLIGSYTGANPYNLLSTLSR